jgi:hypothetical protein
LADFTAELKKFNQTILFAGVGGHHHNRHVERSIGMYMSISHTMLLHASIHWPQVADPQLWPTMAVKYAVFLWNHMPNEHTGLSPLDVFTGTRWPIRKYHDLHVVGCPAYVLDKRLSDGNKIPKWTPCSRRRIFMGLSPRHASYVPLILNFDTGAITPQFHVVLDNWFATIGTEMHDLPDFSSESWASLFRQSVFQFVADDESADDDLIDPTYNPVPLHVDLTAPSAVTLRTLLQRSFLPCGCSAANVLRMAKLKSTKDGSLYEAIYKRRLQIMTRTVMPQSLNGPQFVSCWSYP